MPSTATKLKNKHVHKFKKHTYKSGTSVYFCAQPDCSVKINPALALGKMTICWRCGEAFQMNDYSIRLVKPHCMNCHKSKKELNHSIRNEAIIAHDKPSELGSELAALRQRLSDAVNKISDKTEIENENDNSEEDEEI